jgi:RNA-binding protein
MLLAKLNLYNSVMSLSQKQVKQLRKLVHHRKVIVIIGQHGLTDNVMHEIDNALEIHELIKVRINAGDKQERNRVIDQIAQQTGSDVIQRIGHTAAFYRASDNISVDAKIKI